MGSALRGLVAAALLTGAVTAAQGLEVLTSDKLRLDVHGRGQMIGVGELVPDPVRDNARVFLFLKQARLGFKGAYDDVRFETLLAFGGENANGSNTDLGLLDFVADVPLSPLGDAAVLKIGQFRVPYSREGLTDRGFMNWGERSLMTMAAYQARDYGLALLKTRGSLTGTIGVFSAGGRDVPQRYLPETLGVPEVVARVGYNDGLDEDIYHVAGTDLELSRTAKAAYLNALFMQDTKIGHSTVLNVRTIDKNLLVDSSYNPFISAGPGLANGTPATLQRGNIWFIGGDAAIRQFLSAGKALEAEAEVNWGGYSNRYGSLHIGAARVQAGYRFQPYHVALRYAALMMDRGTNYRTAGRQFSPAVGSVIHEVTPSLAWHIRKHHMKLVADAPVYLNMPVFVEQGVGAYVFAQQPGQVSILATGHSVKRHAIVQGRMMFQFLF
ncbi:MAG: hypothetical protein HY554_12875 [Elusimicrobia bacterium]|nr:hypothetical protein [Elusimicrobiota bacterium]